MTTVEAFAPAKINLTLHITGQRADGYHLLDSLVCFADVGDVIRAEPAGRTQISVSGPFARDVPTDTDNLVAKAADILGVTAQIHIEKHLPVAAGIGGGSADAAAAIKALTALYGIPPPGRDTQMRLGADVPVCGFGGIVRMRGIGEEIDVVSSSGLSWPTVLVNPGVPVSTPAVFARLARKINPPVAEPLPNGKDPDFPEWIASQRNDLEAPAIAEASEIARVLASLRLQSGCLVARMSGSGATCFAIFDQLDSASCAVEAIRSANPDWWAVVAIS